MKLDVGYFCLAMTIITVCVVVFDVILLILFSKDEDFRNVFKRLKYRLHYQNWSPRISYNLCVSVILNPP